MTRIDIKTFAGNPKIKDEFYCLNNRGIYCSKDSGISWDVLDIPWAKEYNLQHPWALATKECICKNYKYNFDHVVT